MPLELGPDWLTAERHCVIKDQLAVQRYRSGLQPLRGGMAVSCVLKGECR